MSPEDQLAGYGGDLVAALGELTPEPRWQLAILGCAVSEIVMSQLPEARASYALAFAKTLFRTVQDLEC